MKKHIDPCMHSAEHILNQTMDRMFNVKSSGEISGFQITSSSFDGGVLRIRYKLTPAKDS
jgi:hypothetical protein